MLAHRNTALAKATKVVPYITEEDALAMAQAAFQNARKGERDELMVLVLFQVGLRISEALGLRPMDKGRFDGRPTLTVLGKGRKLRTVACPPGLADRLGSYAYEHGLEPGDRFFPVTRDDILATTIFARDCPVGLVLALRLILAYQVHRLPSEYVLLNVRSPHRLPLTTFTSRSTTFRPGPRADSPPGVPEGSLSVDLPGGQVRKVQRTTRRTVGRPHCGLTPHSLSWHRLTGLIEMNDERSFPL